MKDRRTNKELRRLVGVEPITTAIRSGRLRWYGHMMRKGEEDWVRKCMKYRVEDEGGSWKKRARRDLCKTTRPIHLVKLFTDSSNTSNL